MKYSGAARRGGAADNLRARWRGTLWLTHPPGRLLLGALLYGLTTLAPGLAQAQVNNPPAAPIQILAFPQRDFVSASGYAQGDQVVVKVIHPSGVTASTDPNSPWPAQEDPRALAGAPFAGIVEVNHPGGACWFQTTPDIRPGDKVRITIVSNALDSTRVGRADETTVSNVTTREAVQLNANTIQVHGTAQDANGRPIDIAQVEQRLVANRDLFLLNGRRVLTSAKDGTLAYDPIDAVKNPTGV